MPDVGVGDAASCCDEGRPKTQCLRCTSSRFAAPHEGDEEPSTMGNFVAGEESRRSASLAASGLVPARSIAVACSWGHSGPGRLSSGHRRVCSCVIGRGGARGPPLSKTIRGARDPSRRRSRAPCAGRSAAMPLAVVEVDALAWVGQHDDAGRKPKPASSTWAMSGALGRIIVEEHDAIGERHRAGGPRDTGLPVGHGQRRRRVAGG